MTSETEGQLNVLMESWSLWFVPYDSSIPSWVNLLTEALKDWNQKAFHLKRLKANNFHPQKRPVVCKADTLALVTENPCWLDLNNKNLWVQATVSGYFSQTHLTGGPVSQSNWLLSLLPGKWPGGCLQPWPWTFQNLLDVSRQFVSSLHFLSLFIFNLPESKVLPI